MAFVSDCEHDIFISYAHLDDTPDPGVDKGWVTILGEILATRLPQRLGSRDVSVWRDQWLSHHVSITPQLLDILHQSAILVVILSPAYLDSEWCQRERNTFLTAVKERRDAGSRVFLVEFLPVTVAERPQEFRELLGYRFWVQDQSARAPRTLGQPTPTRDDTLYYDQINDLSDALAKELQRLQKTAGASPPLTPTPAPRAIVFLAEVTDDLDPQRNEVRRYLEQAGLFVLPVPATEYPRGATDFQRAVDRDLEQCQLFVQLLSGVAGKRPQGGPKSYACLQYERAVAAGTSTLQWRSPTLDMQTLQEQDAEHHALVNGDTVFAVSFADFKLTVVQQTLPKPPERSRSSANRLVFVNAEADDRPLAKDVSTVLDKYRYDYVLPLESGKPQEMRKDLEQNICDCDALILIYGRISNTWVREQLRQFRKVGARRKSPLRALAIYEGPPQPKASIDFKLQDMYTLHCSEGLKEEEIKKFLKALDTERFP